MPAASHLRSSICRMRSPSSHRGSQAKVLDSRFCGRLSRPYAQIAPPYSASLVTKWHSARPSSLPDASTVLSFKSRKSSSRGAISPKRMPVSANSRMMAVSRRSLKSVPSHSASMVRTASIDGTGTGTSWSGTVGGLILSTGFVSMMPSPATYLKNCCSDRYCPRACSGESGSPVRSFDRASRFSMYPPGCSRVMSGAEVGSSLRSQSAKSDALEVAIDGLIATVLSTQFGGEILRQLSDVVQIRPHASGFYRQNTLLMKRCSGPTRLSDSAFPLVEGVCGAGGARTRDQWIMSPRL